MRSRLNPRQRAEGMLFRDDMPIVGRRRGPKVASGLGLRGFFVVKHFRNGERYNEYHFHNDITNEGKDALLNIMFDGGTQISVWYLGLIDDVNFSALANDDTYDDIDQAGNGWDEFKSYTDANNADSTTTRPVWPADPAASQSITNTTLAIYDLTAGGTIKGLFTAGGGVNSNLKGDHAADGTLWATALFAGGDAIAQSGDQLQVTYTVSA